MHQPPTLLSMPLSASELPAEWAGKLARYGLLRAFVRAECLAEAVAEVELSEQEVEQARQDFAQELQFSDQADIARHVHAHVLTSEALEAQALLSARQAKFSQREFGPKAEARFLERKNQLDLVVYSLLRVKDQGLARELYLRVEEGEAHFADLAADYAEGPEKSTRGIVGPVPLMQAHPLLVDRLRTAKPGIVLEPFLIENWWLVVRLESFTPASFNDEVAARMAHELFEQWLASQVEQRLNVFREQLLGRHES